MSELQATDYPKKNTQEATKSKLSYLLAYDGSDHAKAAISLLLDLPQKSGVPPERCSVSLISVLPTQWIEGHENIQQELLEEKQKFRELGFEVETILKAGNPAATINAHAEETQADLVIIGAKGRRATLGILLGGVAQQVVEYSSRPVLVVHPTMG
jgi:nucleotide-binding universal stress UspA family protein